MRQEELKKLAMLKRGMEAVQRYEEGLKSDKQKKADKKAAAVAKGKATRTHKKELAALPFFAHCKICGCNTRNVKTGLCSAHDHGQR